MKITCGAGIRVNKVLHEKKSGTWTMKIRNDVWIKMRWKRSGTTIRNRTTTQWEKRSRIISEKK